MNWQFDWRCLEVDFGRHVPGELDVVEDDERALYVKDCAVVHSGSNVVVAYGGAGVYDVMSHFTRIVCCFSCKLLKFASRQELRRRF